MVRVYNGFFFNLGRASQCFQYCALIVLLSFFVVCSALSGSGEHWTGKNFHNAFPS